jgi:hypothetical protein
MIRFPREERHASQGGLCIERIDPGGNTWPSILKESHDAAERNS